MFLDGSQLSLYLSRSLLLSFQAVTMFFSVCLCAVSLLYLPVPAGCEAGKLCLRGLALRTWCAFLRRRRHRVTALPVSCSLLLKSPSRCLYQRAFVRLCMLLCVPLCHIAAPNTIVCIPNPENRGFASTLRGCAAHKRQARQTPLPPPCMCVRRSACVSVCLPVCLRSPACTFAGLSQATARHICVLRA